MRRQRQDCGVSYGWGLALVLSAMLVPVQAFSEDSIVLNEVEAHWEDSLAVLNAHIDAPLSDELQHALESGVTIQFEFDIYLTQTGYVKRLTDEMSLEFDVWSSRYRIVTPIGPLAINDFGTVQKFFRDDLILLVHEDELPREGAWFVKVRVEAFPVDNAQGDATGSLERELRGLTGWLFRRSDPNVIKSDWSPLARLVGRESLELQR